jgi:hypothetical protein
VVLRAVIIKLLISGIRGSVIWYRGYQPIRESSCLHLMKKEEAERSSEMFTSIYQTKWHYILRKQKPLKLFKCCHKKECKDTISIIIKKNFEVV